MSRQSSGAKKELTIAIIASSFFMVSIEGLVEDTVIIEDLPEIDKALLAIAKEVVAIFNSWDMADQEAVDRQIKVKLLKVQEMLKQELLNLELLGLYIMHTNFLERKEKLSSSLSSLLAFDYIDLADRICHTSAGRLEKEMFDLAYLVIEEIKR